jgi:RHS repeat-associated protein
MGHIWVSALGNLYDPSYKVQVAKTSIDLAAAMGCGTASAPTCGAAAQTALLSAPTSTGNVGGATTLTNLNQSALEAHLTAYATSLQHYIQSANAANYTSSHSTLQVQDVVGGLMIDAGATPPATFTSLPYASAVQYTWTGDVPDQFRTTLTVQVRGINQLTFADETAGSRLRVFVQPTNETNTNTGLNIALYSEYMLLAATTSSGETGAPIPVSLSVTHPYASAGYANETLNYLAQLTQNSCGATSGCTSNYWLTNLVTIAQGWGDTTESTNAHYDALAQRDETHIPPETLSPQNPALTVSEQVYFTTIRGFACRQPSVAPPTVPEPENGCHELHQQPLASSWLAQVSQASKLVGGMNSTAIQLHHSLGLLVSGLAAPGFIDFNIQTTLSSNSVASVSADRESSFLSLAAVLSRLEGAIIEQQGYTWEGGSGISMLARSNSKSIPLLDVTSANVNTAVAQLVNYSASSLSDIKNYVANGYEMYVPQNGYVGTFCDTSGQCPNFLFTGLAAYSSTGTRAAYLSSALGWSKGSGGSSDPVNTVDTLTTISNYSVKNKKDYAVDLNTGDFSLSPPPDLATGTGPFPYALSYQRLYQPGEAFVCGINSLGAHVCNRTGGEPAQLPMGWTHKLEITARLTNDGLASLGRQCALDAARAIAALYTMRTLNTGARSFQSNITNVFAANWFGAGLSGNVVAVRQPPATTAFVRLTDGSFNPPPGTSKWLTQTGTRSFNGSVEGWVSSALTFTMVDHDGSTINFSYGCNDAYGVASLFLANAWKFPSGVALTFNYSTCPYCQESARILQSVQNNLGRSLSFSISVEPLVVTDDSGRTVRVAISPTATPNPSIGYWPSDFLINTLLVTGPDGATSRFDYVPAPATNINRTYFRVYDWVTPVEQATSATPLVTAAFDSLYRVNATIDNSSPTRYTTTYALSGLYASENQKRSDVIDQLGAVTTKYADRWDSLVETIDPLGRTTNNTYDTGHRLIHTTYPDLNYDTYTYDVRSNRLSTTHKPAPGSSLSMPPPESTSYMEGATTWPCASPATCNQPATTTDADNHTTNYTYLASGTGQLERVTGPVISAPASGTITGQVTGQSQTDYCYSATNGSTGTVSLLVAAIEKADVSSNRVKAFAYDAANDWTLSSSSVDPSATYVPPATAGGPCTSTTKAGALALTTHYVFDAGTAGSGPGNVTSITDADLHTTTFTFDAMRRLTGKTPPASTFAFTRYCYDLDGELLSTNKWRTSSAPIDPNAGTAASTGQCAAAYATSAWEIESRTYFPTGDLHTVADTAGNTTTYAYDPDGRQQVVQDPVGRQRATVYDLAGQVIAQWHGGSAWIASTGQPSSTVPVATTSWTPSSYVASGPFRYESYCNGAPAANSQNCYSPNGKPLYAIDADNHVTQYQYDGLDRLRVAYFPDPTTGTLCRAAAGDGTLPTCTGQQTYELSAYDPVGNRTSLLTRRGDTIGYQYDAANHEIIKSPAGQGAVFLGLDLLGEPYTLRKAAYGALPGHTTGYTYDAAGRKKSESNDGLSVSYAYDGVGNRTQITWPDGYYVSYAYDPLNRMQYVRENSATTNELAYYVYDPLSRRSSLCLGAGGKSCATTAWTNQITYGYEPLDGELSALTHELNTTTVSFGYARNAAYQIQNLAASDSFYLPAPTANASTSYAPNALNEYASVAGNTYQSDPNGNLLRWTPPGGTAVQTDTYDSENRLTSAAYGTTTDSFDYDALGRRVAKTYNGVTTLYLHDADDEIAEYSGSALSSGALLRRYVTGPGVDDRITHIEGATTSPPVAAHTYYHVNHQGSVVDMTDDAGNVSGGVAAGQRFSYDEYGNLSGASNATGEQFRYTGRRYDAETGLYYYRARYYSPQLGRFLQVDPVGYKDDVDLYTYVGNDPLDKTDPSGKCFEDACVLEGTVAVEGIIYAGAAIAATPFISEIADKLGNLMNAKQEPGSRPGKAFTPKGKDAVKDDNKSKNGGQTTCENCGQPTTPGQQGTKGVTPPDSETHVDHIEPKSKGGSGTPENGQVLCRGCNLQKGNKTPDEPPTPPPNSSPPPPPVPRLDF